ncbi:MAG: MraY family glycosyltransferase, partial [Endomicrobiia bacterium]|nr:MraY family glycosyltransferase [Endomicrobiia bacterium]
MKNKIKIIPLLIAAALLLHPGGGRWAWLLGARWFYVFLVALLMSYSLSELLIPLGYRLKILDIPEERKMHSAPTPRIGGLAVFVAVMVAIFRNLQFSKELSALAAGGAIIYIVGFIDDIKPQKANVRLLAQTAAALVVLLGGVRITSLPSGFPAKLAIEYVVTIIWLIGIANALNFLDGVNGLAAGMAALCAALFFLVAFPTRQSYLAYTTMALSGACIGFLPANMRGGIFLGDAGATFIGFMLA